MSTKARHLKSTLFLACVVIAASSTLLLGLGCSNSANDEDQARSFPLRGSIAVEPRPGTEVDLDELAARNMYGTTITDPSGERWFISADGGDGNGLASLGLVRKEIGGRVFWMGETPGDAGTDCRVAITVDGDQIVMLSRPADSRACPEAAEYANWLPDVEKAPKPDDGVGVAQQGLFGDVLGSFNGITAYSNGSVGYNSGQYSTCGLKWQCVEYVNRYFYQALGHKNLKGTGNANVYYSTAAGKGLKSYPNCGMTKPAVGDMLASNGGAYGHIAIVREVGANYVAVIHQNWSNTGSDNYKSISMSTANGKYCVNGFSASYPVQGWLRH